MKDDMSSINLIGFYVGRALGYMMVPFLGGVWHT